MSGNIDSPTFYEFFAGGGMVRLGLGEDWNCLFANDFSEEKAASYKDNFEPSDHLIVGDVANLSTTDMPGYADLLWASFPCQDLSLAGQGKGLEGERSGVYWSFVKHTKNLINEGRKPRILAIENVEGAVSSNNGKDFGLIIDSLVDMGYRAGAMIVDAVHFVPQSRPRLFVIAISNDISVPEMLLSDQPSDFLHPTSIRSAFWKLSKHSQDNWLWFSTLPPAMRNTQFGDLIEETPTGTAWHTKQETNALLGLMNDLHLNKVKLAKLESLKEGRTIVGGVYKRTRNGQQRAEVRFDDIAGCLRTPKGGSSRQSVLVVNGDKVRSRLLSTREAARLMGIDDSYILPKRYNQAYQLAGDGVAVPVVSYLSEMILLPIIEWNKEALHLAAE